MTTFPDQSARGTLPLRYEDVTQDGRPRLALVPGALGTVWQNVDLGDDARRAIVEQGVLPILTRLVVDTFDGPFSVDHAFEVSGTFGLAHAKNARGEIERLFLDMTAEISAPLGRTHFPPPPEAGTRAVAGKVFAEHVFTKPFAPSNERKVLSLPLGGASFVPPRERPARAPREVLTIAPGATALEPAVVVDETPLVMGPTHTDSNQHVNSLVYPELFEEAVLRRLVSHRRSPNVLARSLEIAYRRPSFAGETLRISLQLFERAGAIEAAGVFLGDGETELDKARAFVRMTLR